jgi:hypothetical protein
VLTSVDQALWPFKAFDRDQSRPDIQFSGKQLSEIGFAFLYVSQKAKEKLICKKKIPSHAKATRQVAVVVAKAIRQVAAAVTKAIRQVAAAAARAIRQVAVVAPTGREGGHFFSLKRILDAHNLSRLHSIFCSPQRTTMLECT